MMRLLRLAVRLYPPTWRRRYGRELEALLEDITPGWADFMDVVTGALAMQMKRRAAIPILTTVAGAIAGAIVAASAPTLFASTATLRVDAPQRTEGERRAQDVARSVDRVLAEAGASRRATLVMALMERSSPSARLEVTYLDRDPLRAQRVAAKVSAAIASRTEAGASAATVISAASLPMAPIARGYPSRVASGAFLGLLGGAVVTLLLRRRRPAQG